MDYDYDYDYNDQISNITYYNNEMQNEYENIEEIYHPSYININETQFINIQEVNKHIEDDINNNFKSNQYIKKNYFQYKYNIWHDYSIKFMNSQLNNKQDFRINKNNLLNKVEYNLLNMQGGSLHQDGTRTPRSSSYSQYGNTYWNHIGTNIGMFLETEDEPTPRNNRSTSIKDIDNIKDIICIGNVMNFYVNLNLKNIFRKNFQNNLEDDYYKNQLKKIRKIIKINQK